MYLEIVFFLHPLKVPHIQSAILLKQIFDSLKMADYFSSQSNWKNLKVLRHVSVNN